MRKKINFDNVVTVISDNRYFVLSRERTEDGKLGRDNYPKFLVTVHDGRKTPASNEQFFCYGSRERGIVHENGVSILRLWCDPVTIVNDLKTMNLTLIFNRKSGVVEFGRDCNILDENGNREGVVFEPVFEEYYIGNGGSLDKKIVNKMYASFMRATDPDTVVTSNSLYDLRKTIDNEFNEDINCIESVSFECSERLFTKKSKQTVDSENDDKYTFFHYKEDGDLGPTFEEVTREEHEDLCSSKTSRSCVGFSLYSGKNKSVYVRLYKASKGNRPACLTTVTKYSDNNELIKISKYFVEDVRVDKIMRETDKKINTRYKDMYLIMIGSGNLTDEISSITLRVVRRGLFGMKREVYIESEDINCSTRKIALPRGQMETFLSDLEKFVTVTYVNNPFVAKIGKRWGWYQR